MNFYSLTNLEALYNYCQENRHKLTPRDSNDLLGVLLEGRYSSDLKDNVDKWPEGDIKLYENLLNLSADLIGDLYGTFHAHHSVNAYILAAFKDIFLKPNMLNTFISMVLSITIINPPKSEKIALQKELIKEWIAKGGDPRKALTHHVSLSILNNQKDLLLTKDTADLFLHEVVRSNFVFGDGDEIIQHNLIKDAIDMGADVNKLFFREDNSFYYFYFLTLYLNKDLLLTRESAKGFLLALSYTYTHAITPDIMAQKPLLIKEAIEYGIDLDDLANNIFFRPDVDDLEVYKNFFEHTKSLNADTLLAIILRSKPTVSVCGMNDAEKFDPQKVEQQKAWVLYALEHGADVNNLSLKELNRGDIALPVAKLLIEHGMDPQVLLLVDLDMEGALDILKLAKDNGAKFPGLFFINLLTHETMYNQSYDFIKDMDFDFNHMCPFDEAINQIAGLSSKFEEYINSILGEDNDKHIEDYSKETAYGGTIAHILAKNGRLEHLEYLINTYHDKLDLNALNSHGQTPLFFAIYPNISDFLLRHGADPSIVDQDGLTWENSPYREKEAPKPYVDYLVDEL